MPVEVFFHNFLDRCNTKLLILVFMYCPFGKLHRILVSYSSNEYGFVIQVEIAIFKYQLNFFV